MKKFLAALGLLIALSSPAFAEKMYYNSDITNSCNTCHPCTTGAACPVFIQHPCNTCATPIVLPINPCNAGCPVAVPVAPCNTCNPCATGAACPVVIQQPCNTCAPACNTCAPVCCPQKRGLWSRFLRSGY